MKKKPIRNPGKPTAKQLREYVKLPIVLTVRFVRKYGGKKWHSLGEPYHGTGRTHCGILMSAENVDTLHVIKEKNFCLNCRKAMGME